MRLIFLSLILCLSLQSFAQSFNGGIRFGANGSQVNGDGLEGFDKAGVLFGAFVKRHFSEKFTVQMEMVFIQKGSRKPTNENNEYYLMRLGYIEVPVLAIYNVNKKFSFYGGASYGVLISDEEKDQYGVFKNRPPFKKYEVAAHAGMLYSISEKWNFDLRYSHSITTIRPYIAGITTFFDKGQYNVLIEAALEYTF